MEPVSTGITQLDKRLGGGVPAGSVVAIQVPATSSGELLGAMLTQRAGGSRFERVPDSLHYLSTAKYPGEIQALVREPMTDGATAASAAEEPASTLQVCYSNLVASPPASYHGSTLQTVVRHYRVEAEESGDCGQDGGGDVSGTRPSLVVDAMSAVLRRVEPGIWSAFVTDCYEAVSDAGGVGYLYLYRDPDRPWRDDERQVLQRCDGVFEYVEGADVDHLVVRRLRGSRGKPVQAGGDNDTGLPFEVPLAVSREVVVDATDTF